MMRRLFLLLIITFFVSPALADDYAQRRILGFSPDGHYFAFEQFGVGDPSGIAFSDIFVIDTRKNRWLKDTPLSVALEPDDDDISHPREARRLNAAKAGVILKSLAIEPNYRILASNPMNQESVDPHRVSFRLSEGKFGPIHDLVLSEFHLKHPNEGEPPVAGFTLGIGQGLEGTESGELVGGYAKIEMPVPAKGFPGLQAVPYYDCSLGYDCATRYAIADVIFSEDFEMMVVLIAAHHSGHNNGRGRFLAIVRKWGDWG